MTTESSSDDTALELRRSGRSFAAIAKKLGLTRASEANDAFNRALRTRPTDEQVVLLADIASTGFSGAESANIRIGDTVAVFAQGPIGLCATAGAKLIGASFIIGVDGDPIRMEMSKRMGAHVVLDPNHCDVVAGRSHDG